MERDRKARGRGRDEVPGAAAAEAGAGGRVKVAARVKLAEGAGAVEETRKQGARVMPGGDGTGPAGLGPTTGRAAGICAGYPVPGFMNPMPGRGFWGRGRGGGWGRRNWFHAAGPIGWQRAAGAGPAYAVPPVTKEQQLEFLKAQAEAMSQQVRQIQEQIRNLEQED